MKTEQDVTGAQTETGAAEEVDTTKTGAAEEATAGEAKEKEGAAAEQTQEPEEEKKRKDHNRKNAEQRLKDRRIRDLEIENARLRGFQEGVQKAGGKTETTHRDTADPVEAEFLRTKPKPMIDQFENTAEFHEALTDWKIDFRDFKRDHTTRRTAQEQAQQSFEERVEAQRAKGEEKYDDFEQVVHNVDLYDATFNAIVESERGEDIMYYLAGNPEVKARFEKMTPSLQIKEVGRIEAGMDAGTITAKKEVKRISTAPEPAPSAKGSVTVDSSEARYVDDKTSTEERIAISQARKGKK